MKLDKLLVTLVVTMCGLAMLPVVSARRINRRSDLEDVPPLSQSGYKLPQPCPPRGSCNNTLTGPPEEMTLQHLALARGTNLYNCRGRDPTQTPLFELQTAILWDAAPIIPKVVNENSFHTLVPQLLQFDYGALVNSSLICIGTITTIDKETSIDLYNVGMISATIRDAVNAPADPLLNLPWTHIVSHDLSWHIYRVETALGGPPLTCGGRDTIETVFAAEYWFYH